MYSEAEEQSGVSWLSLVYQVLRHRRREQYGESGGLGTWEERRKNEGRHKVGGSWELMV